MIWAIFGVATGILVALVGVLFLYWWKPPLRVLVFPLEVKGEVRESGESPVSPSLRRTRYLNRLDAALRAQAELGGE